MRVAFLSESNQNDLRTLKSLEEEMENEEIRFRVVVKEMSNCVNSNSRKYALLIMRIGRFLRGS